MRGAQRTDLATLIAFLLPQTACPTAKMASRAYLHDSLVTLSLSLVFEWSGEDMSDFIHGC